MTAKNGIIFTWPDDEVVRAKESGERAKAATDALSAQMRDTVKVLQNEVAVIKSLKVKCSCGRLVKLIDADLHNKKHEQEGS